MRLQHMTWMEVEAYLKEQKGIIVPIGSTEQHGPIGLIGTDAICPEVIADKAAETLGCIIGPTISVGMAQHHLAFPGSVALRPSTLILVIRDYVLSLARNGFERFYFLNGHGGNIATTQAAFSEIYAETSLNPGWGRPHIRCKLANWFGFQPVTALCKELYGDRDGSHATASEVAVTQYACPEHIKSVPMEPAPPRPRAFLDADDYRSIHPDGRIGADSFLATPEAGGKLVATSAASVIEDYKAFMAEA
ncbi:amidase [Thalassobaculum fulvum]|uniref:Amidase n=1 Tax=Thalassobaculum fulvum TaxID=1633335 RepID=A0A918XRT5_9PROT|nr:creatininase family protein [Thalassobaculum fulvum]GHD50808.1 amidase [Thalassobaculum fulvum]